MKILITGFDPFGGESVNPSWEAVKNLPDTIKGAEIVKKEIPTSFERSAKVLEALLEIERPDKVLCVGQAGGRTQMMLEWVAINLMEASLADNDGAKPCGVPVRGEGETAYFSTLPVKAMVKAGRDAGVPCKISYSAGTFVCNSVMYHALYLAEKKYPQMQAGFLHVPFSAEQAARRPGGAASMALSDMTRCLAAMIAAAVDAKDVDFSEGTTH